VTADHFPDRLIFAGCLAVAAAGAVVAFLLRQIDKVKYGPVTS
jgi:3-hydroxymyristoyl/3-hydroxydecanoyl-(acyl carrier protein) dehydratase